ncbi:MAG: rhomboid family intramembrane serine protease [Thermodesulfobacteriota bacterium]
MTSSLLCPNCRKLISADESRCPYCGISFPGSRWRNNFLTRILGRTDVMIRTIIFINAGMYLLTVLFNSAPPGVSMNPLTYLSPDNTSLMLLGATGTFPIDKLHRWWTILSANYLHGGILHILFNMFAFWQLSPLVAREYGNYRTFIIYTLGGASGFIVSYLAGVTFTIGASAAICSLIGAILYYGKSRGGVYGQIIYKQVGAWALSIFIFGFLVRGINNWGHGGGMLAGMLLGVLLGYREKKAETSVHRALAVACVVVSAATLIWAFFSGIYYRIPR